MSIYDCVAATMARTHATRADAERSIARDPTQCARPNFHLATTPDEPPDTGTWVVDGARRPPTAAERAYLPREELAAWPPVPTLTVGARVVVTGHFSTTSPAGAASDGGLIVYSGLEQRLATQPPTIQPGPPPTLAPPPVIVDPGTPIAPALAEACRAALARRDVLAMAAPCAQASDAAPRDAAFAHLAGGAAFQRAFAPGAAVDAELATAQRYLARAVANDPRLWRAHLYLGKIAYRAGDHFAAAHAFTAALRADPSQGEPALLLARLYRAWRRWPEALAVYQVGQRDDWTLDAAMFVFEAGAPAHRARLPHRRRGAAHQAARQAPRLPRRPRPARPAAARPARWAARREGPRLRGRPGDHAPGPAHRARAGRSRPRRPHRRRPGPAQVASRG